MGLPKGTTNNSEGRPAGTPNKITAQIREALLSALLPEVERIPEYFAQIQDPAQRLALLSKLLPYVAPKLNSVTIEAQDEEGPKRLQITVVNSREELERLEKLERELQGG